MAQSPGSSSVGPGFQFLVTKAALGFDFYQLKQPWISIPCNYMFLSQFPLLPHADLHVSYFAFVLIRMQFRGSSGILTKITFTGEDIEFLHRRQQALEVR